MDYEKKYRDLVEAVKKLQEANPFDDSIQNWVRDNVPELNESEDDRIRKELIEFLVGKRIISNDLEGINVDKTLIWLEKQGQEKPLYMSIKEKAHQIAWETSKHYDPLLSKECWCEMSALDMASWLKKQGKTDSSIKWHDVSEKPEKNRELLCEWVGSNNCIWHDTVFYNSDNEAFWNYGRRVDYVTRWCYVDELIQGEQKPWSEEDNNRLEEAICMIESNGNWVRSDDAVKQISFWLKSFKDRYIWKPNEEQMDALETVTSSLQSTTLESLYNDLKKLRGD